MRPDMVPGAKCPDYVLPDHTGTPRRLSELQGEDPLPHKTRTGVPGDCGDDLDS